MAIKVVSTSVLIVYSAKMRKSTSDSTSNPNESSAIRKKLYVKYLVCLRDKLVLKSELDKLKVHYEITIQGAVGFKIGITTQQFLTLKRRLLSHGLVLLDETESLIVDRIINTIIEVVHYSDVLPDINFTEILSNQLALSDKSIHKLFSDVMGLSFSQFILIHKIERAKELLLYENFTLTEIAAMLNYKNRQSLVAHFKKNTGLYPSYFTVIKRNREQILSEALQKSE
jgi:AraC-like DNA-binding protein